MSIREIVGRLYQTATWERRPPQRTPYKRYEKLQQNDLPAISSFGDADEENGEIEEEPDDEAQSVEQAATMTARVRTRASTEI